VAYSLSEAVHESKDFSMRITLNRSDLARFIEEQVARGEYPTPDAVVEEAVARLKSDLDDGDWAADQLRQAVSVGLDQLARGDGIELRSDQALDDFFEDVKRTGQSQLTRRPNTP